MSSPPMSTLCSPLYIGVAPPATPQAYQMISGAAPPHLPAIGVQSSNAILTRPLSPTAYLVVVRPGDVDY